MKLLSITNANNSVAYFRNSREFVDELASYLAGKRVLEVFAGNGLLAGLLAAKGVQVTATTIFGGSDGHVDGLYHPVEAMSAPQAVTRHGESHDVLLMSWPTVTPEAFIAAMLMQKPVVVIGEVTDYSKNNLGGCATDHFWAHARPIHLFKSYQGRGIEQAQVVEMLSQPCDDFMNHRAKWELASGYKY